MKLQSLLPEATKLEKAKILYTLATRFDSLETSVRIDFCIQAEKIAMDFENNEL